MKERKEWKATHINEVKRVWQIDSWKLGMFEEGRRTFKCRMGEKAKVRLARVYRARKV